MLFRSCRLLFTQPSRSRSTVCAQRRELHGATPRYKPIQQLRDEAIRSRIIRVVQQDGETESLGPVTTKDKILASMDRSKNWLMLVDEQELGEEEARSRNTSPLTKVGICKIVNKKEAFQKAKERSTATKERKLSNKKEEKEIQLTWGVAVNDLQHKLKKANQTLEKGGRAALVITSPKGSKPPPPADRRMFTDMVKDQLGLSDGRASIWKADEWRGAKAMIYLEGVKGAIQKSGPLEPKN